VALARRILRENRRLILPLAVALLANIALYAVVVYPLRSRVAGAEERSRSARAALRAADQSLAAAKATLTGKERAQAALRTFHSQTLPGDFGAARHVLYLRMAQLAREAGLQYKRLSQEQERAGQDSPQGLRRMSLSVVLEGDYAAIRRFVHALETAPEFVIIDSMALAAKSQPTDPLVLTMTLSTYFRTRSDGA
jgi:Tfp pilus assembly protein PilO